MKSSFEPAALPGHVASGFVAREAAAVAIEAPSGLAPLPLPPAPTEPAGPEGGAHEEDERVRQEVEAAAAESAEARAAELARLRDVVARLEEGVAEARRELLDERRRWLGECLDLAFALAEKVLERELSLDPTALHGRVEHALELLDPAPRVEVAVSTDAFALVQEGAADVLSRLGERSEVEVVPSADLAPDLVRVSSGASTVDAGIAVFLETLRDALEPEWNPEPDPEEAQS